MLGGVLLDTRHHHKPWILSSPLLYGSPVHHSARLGSSHNLSHLPTDGLNLQRRRHSSACKLGGGGGSCGGAALIWHSITPCDGGVPGLGCRRDVVAVHHDHELKGEGSWNVAWDSRPARWLHRPDSAWLLFGVCACLAPPPLLVGEFTEALPPTVVSDENSDEDELEGVSLDSADYRVIGVLADGRCLFRAIAHGACLRNGEEAPDENHQKELADELRAQVVDELLKRREEIKWFIEEDFDAYVKRIQQPYVWGGEPELLMASHVLKTPISVFMRDTRSVDFVNIAKYGEDYRNANEISINIDDPMAALEDVIDSLQSNYPLEVFYKMAELAHWCMHDDLVEFIKPTLALMNSA